MLYLLEPIRKSIAVDSMRNISGMPAIGIAAPISALFAVTQIEPIVEAAKHHMETDVPVDAARDKAIATSVLYVLGLTVSCFIGWLFSHFGGGK